MLGNFFACSMDNVVDHLVTWTHVVFGQVPITNSHMVTVLSDTTTFCRYIQLFWSYVHFSSILVRFYYGFWFRTFTISKSNKSETKDFHEGAIILHEGVSMQMKRKFCWGLKLCFSPILYVAMLCLAFIIFILASSWHSFVRQNAKKKHFYFFWAHNALTRA